MMNEVLAATVMTVSGAFVVGLVLALLGSIKLNLARHLQLSERGITGLFACLNLALIPSMFASGVLIDRFGVRWVLLGGSILTAAAVFTMSRMPRYRRALLAILLAGLGSAGISTSCIVLMPLAFFSEADLRATLVLKVNLGHVFIALGALLTPALTDVLFRTLHYRRTIIVLSVLCLVPAVLCLVPSLGENLPHPTDQGTIRILDNVIQSLVPLLLAGLVFFFYAPLEGAVSVWTTTYLTEMGDGEGKATWILTGFWTTFLASRLLVSYLLYTRHAQHVWPWLLVLSSVLTAVVLGNQVGTASRTRARVGLLFIGFFLGPIFPTLLGLLLSLPQIPEKFRGTTYGLFFAFGSLGSLLLAPFVGHRVGTDSSLQLSRLPVVLALFMTILAIGFVVAAGT
jgi:MFS family permease